MWIVALCSWMQAFQKTAAGGLLVFRIIRPQFNVKRKMVIKDWHEVLILWIAQVRQRERAVAVDRAREWLKRGSSVRDTKHYFLIVTFMVSLHYKIQINTWAPQHNAEDFVWMHASLCLLCACLCLCSSPRPRSNRNTDLKLFMTDWEQRRETTWLLCPELAMLSVGGGHLHSQANTLKPPNTAK